MIQSVFLQIMLHILLWFNAIVIIAVLLGVTLCKLSGRYERFGGNLCIHLQGRKLAGGPIRIHVAVRTRKDQCL